MPRGSPESHMHAFIDSIPDSKLIGTFGTPGTNIYRDIDYRLDMQSMTTPAEGECIKFNLQVQVNKGCRKRSVAMLAPGSIAWILLPVDETWSPDKIREELRKSVTGHKLAPVTEGMEVMGKGRK
jgi:hypothetical protein